MPAKTYPLLNIVPHWATMNANLVDIVDLIPDDALDWAPAPSHWSMRVIIVHIILARHHHLMAPGAPPDYMPSVINDSRTKAGLQKHLVTSWELLEGLITDQAKLDALYEPPSSDPDYSLEPSPYDGHYIAYHRFAHDIHHRSTLLGHMRQVGIPIAGHLIRPLD
jgi:hypothetical protein